MLLKRHCEIEKDFKNLKRFPASEESMEAWERLFCLKGLRETPGIEQYPGFGTNKIFKARIIPLKENCGKSKGYRLIFQCFKNDEYLILVFSRHGIYGSEQELINLIKNRLG